MAVRVNKPLTAGTAGGEEMLIAVSISSTRMSNEFSTSVIVFDDVNVVFFNKRPLRTTGCAAEATIKMFRIALN